MAYPKLLSKSVYMNGLQCLKYLLVVKNSPERVPEPSEQDEFRFDEGHLVGDYSKKLFPNGVQLPDSVEDFGKNLEESKKALLLGKVLFEAGFAPEGERIYARADILVSVGKPNKWNLIEVKSSTSVKPENIQDVAFQKYVYEKAGLKIEKCFLMHINNEYVRKGEVEVKELFAKEDISEKVEEEIKLVPERVKEMLGIMDSKKEPKIIIGKHCKSPYECPIEGECWKFLPENHVFELYHGGKRSHELFEKGIIAIREIPDDYELAEKQKIQRYCTIHNKPHVNKEGIRDFLKKLKYPLCFLDFETYATVIPIYDRLKPYQPIPFQFSLHVIDEKGEKKHYSFIAEGAGDPRKKFLEELKKVIGKKGSIIVYNQGFEEGRLKQLGELFPKEKKNIDAMIERMADLLMPFRNFDYHDCMQRGSCSLKEVLPALTGKDYEGMDIGNGGEASLRYLYIIHGDRKQEGKRATKEEVEKVRHDLEKYCGLDTEAMIMILEKLRGAAGE